MNGKGAKAFNKTNLIIVDSKRGVSPHTKLPESISDVCISGDSTAKSYFE